MSNHITASPMVYQEEARIRVDMPYDPALIQQIRRVSGARWSPELRCWHVPKTAEAWRQVKAVFGDIQVVAAPKPEQPAVPPLPPLPKMPASPLAARLAPDKIALLPLPDEKDRMGLHLPAGLVPAHLATVKNIHGRRWDPELKVWRIPCTKLTLRFLDNTFPGCWTGHFSRRPTCRSGWRRPLPHPATPKRRHSRRSTSRL